MFTKITDKAYHLAPLQTENEDAAIRQLQAASEMDGVTNAVGFPDLTPGKGGPVGAALLSHALHPIFVGGDLGCAYSFFKLDLKPRKLRDPAKLLESMDGLDLPMLEADRIEAMQRFHIDPTEGLDTSFGTHGFGNHFNEIQRCHNVIDPSFGMEQGAAYLLVHSGSRALGDNVFRNISIIHGANPVDPDSHDGREWIEKHDICLRWAEASRQTIATRVCEMLGCEAEHMFSLPHNMVERVEHDGQAMWLHRKGASPATQQLSMLAGSRETPSFLITPMHSPDIALKSLAHGAGRRLSRSAAGATTLKSDDLHKALPLSRGEPAPMVACGRPDLLAEERGAAYKDVHSVLDAMVKTKLCATVAEMHPVATFKVSEGHASPQGKVKHYRKNEKQRHAERDRDRSAKRDR